MPRAHVIVAIAIAASCTRPGERGEARERREVPVLRQTGPGCVPYAAAAVAHYHGAAIDPHELLRSVPVGPSGVAYVDVAAELERRGVRARVFHPSVDELRDRLAAGYPLVIGQAGDRADHALVVIARRGEAYTIMDPAHPGRREAPAGEIESRWQAAGRVALLVQ